MALRPRDELGTELGARLNMDLDDVVEKIRARHVRTMARSISTLERRGAPARDLVRALQPHLGKGRTVGVTGPPGAGKSTMVDSLARACRARDERVAILAVDPTSPFTGGAILGDRVRMSELENDPSVFLRSMATRGGVGGLCPACADAIDLLLAAGFDWVFVETVGVGQDEVDIVRTVDCVVVATVPGLGDEIQAIKAGVMEIADVFAINKADRPGADEVLKALRLMLSLREDPAEPEPAIIKTVALRGDGMDLLLEEIERFLGLESDEASQRRQRLAQRVESVLREEVLALTRGNPHFQDLVDEGVERRRDPYTVADELLRAWREQAG